MPSFTENETSLAAAAAQGVRWNYFGNLFSFICSLTITALLARILGPGPFGEIIIASTIYGFVNLFVNGGFGQALVQQENLNEIETRSVFTLQMILSVSFTVLIIISAPIIARVFEVPSAVPVIRAMALIVTLQALGLVSAALLRRDFRFRPIQKANAVSYLAGYVGAGLPLALSGAGVWSLVAAYLTQAFVNSIYLYAMVRHSVRFTLRFSSRTLLFGGTVTASNLVNWGHSNLDNLASSRLGPNALGLYGRVCSLAYQPVTTFVTAIQPVLLSTFSRIRDKPDLLRDVALSSLAITSGLLLPAYLSLAFIPQTVVCGLYGPKWISAVPLLTPMALAMPLWGAMALLGPMLVGLGKPHREFWTQAATCILAGIAFFSAAHISLIVLAWMLFLISALRFAILAYALFSHLGLGVIDVPRVLLARLPFALLISLLLLTTDILLRAYLYGAVKRLIAETALGVFLISTTVVIAPQLAIGQRAVSFVCKHKQHMPEPLRKRLVATSSSPARSISSLLLRRKPYDKTV